MCLGNDRVAERGGLGHESNDRDHYRYHHDYDYQGWPLTRWRIARCSSERTFKFKRLSHILAYLLWRPPSRVVQLDPRDFGFLFSCFISCSACVSAPIQPVLEGGQDDSCDDGDDRADQDRIHSVTPNAPGGRSVLPGEMNVKALASSGGATPTPKSGRPDSTYTAGRPSSATPAASLPF